MMGKFDDSKGFLASRFGAFLPAGGTRTESKIHKGVRSCTGTALTTRGRLDGEDLWALIRRSRPKISVSLVMSGPHARAALASFGQRR